MSRTKSELTPEQRKARAAESLRKAEEDMLRHALRHLSRAQDDYVRAHGEWTLERPHRAPVDARDMAQRRFDAALREAARWRSIVEDARQP